MARSNTRLLLLTGGLVALLTTLATLQYRWLGDVSAAERERLRDSLHARAAELASDFDGTIAELFTAFRVDPDQLDDDPATALAAAYDRAAAASSTAASLVSRVYLFDGGADGPNELRALDRDRRVLAPAPWPPALDSWRRVSEWMPPPPQSGERVLPVFFANSVDAQAPALVIGIPRAAVFAPGGTIGRVTNPRSIVRAAIVLLDKVAVRRRLLEPLVAKHFGSGATAEYMVSVVGRDHPAEVIYAQEGTPRLDEKTADVIVPFFALRPADVNALPPESGRFIRTNERLAITIVRRGDVGSPVRLMAHGEDGAWQLLVRSRAGSLDALVAASRRRNMAISLGVLALLAASFVLIAMSAARQQRLARQQMEFVAAVSHELRTPLAVICSAGENLADGVVADREQVKTYGALVQREGRRLADMVDRVMEFAGLSAGGSRRPHVDLDIAALAGQAAAAVQFEARSRAIDLRVHVDRALPPVAGDPDGLRSAIQNVVGNALKYSPNGAPIDVAVETIESGVRVSVADRGIGIDADDLPHVFEPFFRGRRAIDRQVRGTGVGLSVVRQVVDAHGGTVRIEPNPGGGTLVTIDLPARVDADAAAAQVSHAS